MEFNKQQEAIIKKNYDFLQNWEFPKDSDQKTQMSATAEYATRLETINTLEAIRVAYKNTK